MKHENIVKIYYSDVDSYEIVWHGAYIKWFEIGRIEFARLIGIEFEALEEMEILLPVVELNCRYKSPARLFDKICITTELKELKKTSITCSHSITKVETGNLILNAESTVVATNKKGKLFKRLPDYIFEKYSQIN